MIHKSDVTEHIQVLANNLRCLRKEKGLTWKEMAKVFSEYCSISFSSLTISCWETGRHLPDLDTFMKLSVF